MGKSEAVKKYEKEYLAGRSEAQIAKYRAKDVERQYSSIMSWRHQQRLKMKKASGKISVAEGLRDLRKQFESNKNIDINALSGIQKELTLFAEALKNRQDDIKNYELRQLQAQKDQIEERMRQLGENI